MQQALDNPTEQDARRARQGLGLLSVSVVVLALAVILTGGYVHGVWTGRWSNSHESVDAVARLHQVPTVVGAWTGEDRRLEDEEQVLQAARIKGFVFRNYMNTDNGNSVSMLLVCGLPGYISVHTPDICFAGNGYVPRSNPVREEPEDVPGGSAAGVPGRGLRPEYVGRPDADACLLVLEHGGSLAGTGIPALDVRIPALPLQAVHHLRVTGRFVGVRRRSGGHVPGGDASRTPQGAEPGCGPRCAHRLRGGNRERHSPVATERDLAVDFNCFLLVTAVLLIRPADYFDSSINLYLIVISACLVVSLLSGSLAKVLDQCSPSSLRKWPVSACVIGLTGATILSDLGNMRFDALVGHGVEFGKVLVFFLLLVGLVNTRRRLRILALATPIFISVTVLFSVLQFSGYIDWNAFHVTVGTKDGQGSVYGGLLENRLIGPGSYKDPNDFCTLINTAIMLSIYGLSITRPRILGVIWLVFLGLQGYALMLTQSRGGLLGTLAGLGVLFWIRFGVRKGVLVLAVVLPLFLSFFGGRQVDLNSTSGTAQQRIQLWADALDTWRHAPILGVGGGCLPDYIGRPPHNSFLNAYGDLGFLGGTLFLGAFFLGFWRLYQFRPPAVVEASKSSRGPFHGRVQPASGRPARPQPKQVPGSVPGCILDPELERMRPFLMAAMTSYALNIASTNHTYTVATYAVLGLVAAFIRVVESLPSAGARGMVFDGRMVGRLCLASVVFLILATVYVQLKVRY